MKRMGVIACALVLAWVLAFAVWFFLFFTQTSLAFAVYRITFPVARIATLIWNLDGWALLGVMMLYGTVVACVLVMKVTRLPKILLIALHVILVVFLLMYDS
jgi:hypothetical protein